MGLGSIELASGAHGRARVAKRTDPAVESPGTGINQNGDQSEDKAGQNRAPATEGGKNSPRVIRKYPNRRLYDTVESRYVTLADVRRLVVDRVDFVVLDRKSQQDITRSILLQVIAEQEGAGESLMSRDFLSQVIRTLRQRPARFRRTLPR